MTIKLRIAGEQDTRRTDGVRGAPPGEAAQSATHLLDAVEVVASFSLSEAARDRAKNTPSFLIESLVYNCLDTDHFQKASIYADVVAVLQYLSYVLADRRSGATLLGAPTWSWWLAARRAKTRSTSCSRRPPPRSLGSSSTSTIRSSPPTSSATLTARCSTRA